MFKELYMFFKEVILPLVLVLSISLSLLASSTYIIIGVLTSGQYLIQIGAFLTAIGSYYAIQGLNNLSLIKNSYPQN